jgi:hypothetical protein
MLMKKFRLILSLKRVLKKGKVATYEFNSVFNTFVNMYKPTKIST